MNFSDLIQLFKPSQRTQLGLFIVFATMGGIIIWFPDNAHLFVLEKGFVFSALILFFGLSTANLLCFLSKTFQQWTEKIKHKRKLKKLRDARIAALDNLSKEEAEILSYLVTRNEKRFFASIDGDRAATLVASGMIHPPSRGGPYSIIDTPFEIDDDIWLELQARATEFVHPHPNGKKPWKRNAF
jgi:hypothetical protein